MTEPAPATAEADAERYNDLEWLLGDGTTPVEGDNAATGFIGCGRTKLFEYTIRQVYTDYSFFGVRTTEQINQIVFPEE